MLKEELEKARATAHILEAENGEKKRELIDAKKEVGEQQALVKQLLEQTSPVKKNDSTIVVVYLPKKMKDGGPSNGSAPGAVASILRSV